MLTRLANVFFAGGATLVGLGAWQGWRWAGSELRDPAISRTPLLVLFLLTACWLVCAVGLYRQSRIAWVGSLVGAASSAACLGIALVGFLQAGGEASYPMQPIDVVAAVIMYSTLSFFLAASLGLVAGLFKIRRSIFHVQKG